MATIVRPLGAVAVSALFDHSSSWPLLNYLKQAGVFYSVKLVGLDVSLLYLLGFLHFLELPIFLVLLYFSELFFSSLIILHSSNHYCLILMLFIATNRREN